MKRNMKYICFILLSCLLLTGCGSDVQVAEIKPLGENENRIERLSMLEEASIEYEVKKMLPSIIVSQSGYETDSSKIAVVESKQFPTQFNLVNAVTEKIVYIGYIEPRECSEDGEVLSAIADFSSFTDSGCYYIKTDMLGRSQDFYIALPNRTGKVKNTFKAIHSLRDLSGQGPLLVEGSGDVYIDADGGWITDKSGNKDVISGCLTIIDLLLAYELHPDVFTDEFGITESRNSKSDLIDEIEYEAKWLSKMQNSETGGVYTGVYIPEGQTSFVVGGETTRTTAYYCATMAKLSFDLSKEDSEYSKECLMAATLAWNCLMANKEIVTAEQMFRAAVEMYKLTGQGEYLSVINNYLSTHQEFDYEVRAMLDAAMTYMGTSRIVNLEYCTRMMQQFMARTEEKSMAAQASRFYVEPDKDVANLLRNATELVIADNIISNQEYENIEMNYLYYLSGRNHEGIDYTKSLENVNQFAQLLVLEAELADKKH